MRKGTITIKINLWVAAFLILIKGVASAQGALDSLRNAAETAEKKPNRIRAYIDLSRQVHRIDPNDPEDLYYAELAVKISEEFGDTLLWAESLDNMGLLHRFHSRFGQAIPLHRQALELIREKPIDAYFKMRFANNAGVAARYHGAFDVAVDHYLYALKIAEKEGDLRNIAIASNGLGNSFSQLEGNEEAALYYYLKALEVEKQRENSLGMAMNFLSISSHHINSQAYDTARKYLAELESINTIRKDKHGLAMTYEYMGHAYYEENKDLANADRYYLQALTMFEKQDLPHKVAEIHLALGKVALKFNQKSAAMDRFGRALEIAKDIGAKNIASESAGLLSETMETLGDFRRSLKYYKIADAYKDSIKLTEQEVTIAGLKLAYDFQKKENEIQLLRAENELRHQEIELQKEKNTRERILLLGILLFLTVSLGIVLLWLRTKNLQKSLALQREAQARSEAESTFQNNLLQAEILATRMQLNPHFLFNCLNSIKLLIQKNEGKQAIKYLSSLSKFIRDMLQTSSVPTISLPDELQLTKKYIALEENRFKEKLSVQVCSGDVGEEKLKAIQLPPMILQPFVENAIWHGLLPSTEEHKKLEISCRRKENGYRISVRDNGVGRKKTAFPSTQTHKSMGLKITEQRIALYNQLSTTKLSLKIIDHDTDLTEYSGTEIVLDIE
ncbi:MAG: histidine kinase [Lunatimonas sp.]|uniref:histidine kinase n=1 Tax=Lunatimonas sp. TaxID=2060141 RepID=UPI002A4A3636|nr:histidine kinase [Lunatimonas sp.]